MIVLLGVFGVVIITQFLNLRTKPPVSAPVPANTAKNLNKNNFELLKRQVTPSETGATNVVESRFWGVITNVARSSGLTITLTGKQKPFEGKEVTYSYETSILPKISVYKMESGQEVGVTLNDLKKGTEVYIDEKTDLNKTYADGIVAIKITVIN